MHNAIKDNHAARETADNSPCHSFPDFENSRRAHPDLSDRSEEHFRRADFVKGQFVAADGACYVSSGEGETKVDVQKQAFDAGYREGVLVGRQSAETGLQLLVQRLQKAVDEVNRIGGQLHATVQAHAVKLSLAVTRKIIDREVTVNRSVVVYSLRRALEGLAREAEITVTMHPDDLNYIRALPPGELPEMNEIGGKTSFESDPAMTPGGCVVRTAAGDRDASIDGQMDVVATAFEEALQQCAPRALTAETSDDG